MALLLTGWWAPLAQAVTGATEISFQGKLVNSDGTNVADGAHTVVFSFYTVSSGGSNVWTESDSVTTTDGVFQIDLGSNAGNPLPSSNFNSGDMYLGIKVGSDAEMTPRIHMTAAAYAFYAQNSNALQGLHASDFAQLNPSSAQSGSLNVTGSVQAGTSLQAPLVDTATAVALNIGTGTATSVTIGRTTSSNSVTIQGSAASSWVVTGASGTTTVDFTAPTATNAIHFPNAGGTLCTTTASTCSATYQVASATGYLFKNATDTSSASVGAGGDLYAFTNSNTTPSTGGVLKLDNGANTGSALLVTASGNAGSGNALLVVNGTNGTPSGNLIDLQVSAVSKFAVDTAGSLTQNGGSSTTDTINGQRISSAANFTGTVTAATSLLAPLLDSVSGALAIGTNNATQINLNQVTRVQPAANSNAFDVTAGSGGGSVLRVDTNGSRVGVNLGAGGFNLGASVVGLDVNGALRLGGGGGSNADLFSSPQGASVRSKINIPVYDPGANGQILAFGITGANYNSRAISVFDARTTTNNQPAIAVFAPSEDNLVGFGWDNSNTIAKVKTTGPDTSTTTPSIQLQSGDVLGGSSKSTGNVFIFSGSGSGTDTSSGNVTIDVGTKSGAGTLGQINIGATNVTQINVGRSASTTVLGGNVDQSASTGTFKTGSGNVSLNGDTTVAANKNLILANGTGSLTQTFTSGNAAGTAHSVTVANNNSGAGVVVQGINIAATNNTAPSSGTNAFNAINFAAPTLGGGGVAYGLNFANTGYTDVLRVNGNQIISGAGIVQNAGFSGAVTYSNIQSIGSNAAVLSLVGSSASTFAVGSGGNTTTLKFAAPTGATNVSFPALAGNQNVCYQNDTNCGFVTGSSTAFIQNLAVTATAQSSASFHIDTSGRADVSLLAPLFATSSASSGTTAAVSFQSGNNSGGNSGNVTLDAGTHTGGTGGNLNIGQTNAGAVNFGNSGASLDLRAKASGSSLAFYDAGGTNFTKLQFTAPTATVTLNVPNSGTTVCTDTGSSCNGGGVIGTGYIQNQTASVQTAGFNISGNGTFGGNVAVTGTYNTNTFTSSALTFGASAGGLDTITTAATTGLNLTASGASTWSTSSGNLTVQDTAASSTLALDAGAVGGGNAGTITIGNTNTGTISIGTNAAAHTIQIGTGGAVEGVSIGSSNTTSATTIEGGASGSSGTPSIAIGNGATAHNIQIGTNSGAAQVLTLGSTNASGTITLQAGATTVSLQNTGGTIKTGTNSTSAFQVQNSNSNNLVSADTTNTNLLGNSSFESASAGAWAARGGPTLTFASTDQMLYGAASLKLATSATASDGVKYVPSPQLTNTQVYGLSFWAMTTGANFTVRFGNSNAGTTGGEVNCGTGTVTNTWARFTCTFTAGVQSAGAYIYITQNDSTSRTFYVDGEQLELTAVTAYHEGQLQFNGLVTAPLTIKNVNDSSAAFDVQNASGVSQLTVDTAVGKVTAAGVTLQTVAAVPTIGSTGSALTVGGSSTALTLQGSGSTVLKATNGANTVTVGFAAISGSGTYNFASPSGAGPYTICTSDTVSCATSYGSVFLRKNTADTASADAGTGNLYQFTNSNGTNAAGTVLDLENGGATGSALVVQGGSSLGANKALMFANNTLNNATGNLLDLQSTQGGTQASRFSVSTVGNTTVGGTLASGTLTVTSAAQNTMTGSLKLSGGLDNQSGGITNAGAISGATTIAANNTATLSGTGAAELIVSGAPAASGSSSLVQFGNAISGGSGNGTYLGINLPNASSADFLNFQLNNAARFKVDNGGNVTLAGNITGTNALIVDSASATALSLGTVNANAVTVGRTTTTTTVQGTLEVGTHNTAGTGAFLNNGTTVNTVYNMGNLSGGGWDAGGAATTVDKYTYIAAGQTNSGQTLTPPTPTVSTTYGRVIYVTNTGVASFQMLGTTISPGSTATLIWALVNGTAKWTYAGSDGSGILNQTGANQAANFQIQSNIAGGVATTAATAIIKAAGTQTGDLLQFQPSGSTTPIAKIDINGNLTAQGGAFTGNLAQSTGTVALTANGASSFTTSAGALTITSAAAATWSTTAGDLAVTGAAALNLTGAANSTWSVGAANTLTVTSSNFAVSNAGVVTLAGNQAADLTVTSAAAAATGKSLSLQAGTGGTGNTNGGALNLTAGTAVGSGTGGQATLQGGANAGNATGSAGGAVAINGGSGATATSGATNGGGGGAVTISSGAGGAASTGNLQGGSGADVTIQAGNGGNSFGSGANSNGGNVRLTAGNAGTGGSGANGVPGVVFIDSPVFTSVAETFTQTANNQTFNTTTDPTLQTNVDSYGTLVFTVSGAFTGATITVPAPRNTAAGHVMYIVASASSVSFTLTSTSMPSFTVAAGDTATLVWNGTSWTAGVAASSLQQVYNSTSTSPASIVTTSSTKNLLFQAGTGFDNANLFQIGNSVGAQELTVDTTNTATGLNLMPNSGAETASGFTTTYPAAGFGTSTVAQTTTAGTFASGAAAVSAAPTAATSGLRANLGAALATSTIYNISFTAKLSSGTWTNDIDVRYNRTGTTSDGTAATCSTASATGGSTFNTRTISNSAWTKIVCYLTTSSTAGDTTANIVIFQTASASRTFYIDNIAVVAQNSTGAQDVGDLGVGGTYGQGLTLLTLDSYANTPWTGSGNTALYGSMYYDTTAGLIKCYQASGWGTCGAAPNNNVGLIPEYPNAVLNGTGTNNTGTMTANICSGTSRLSINTTGPCSTTDDFNYYQWTSTQTTAQTYDIYVRYILPPTFNNFTSDNTIQIWARASSTTDGAATFSLYKPNGGGQCGSDTALISSANTWAQVPLGGGGETSCNFQAGDTMTFKVDMSAKNNANVYVSNITFTMTGK